MIANYFADYFARNGFDAAIVHRDESIKKPENLDRLEDILRKSVMRDQLAIDYFEQHMGKRDFGTFGISRGGVNVAISAGVDPRLKYNIIAMGGSAIAKLFRDSDERRIRRFRESVMRDRQMSEDALFEYIDQQIRTDPKNLAQYIDARDAMVILSLFDSTVPIEYGKKLREEMGKPETIYLIADHRTSALYTQFITLLPPGPPGLCNGLFPIDYIETESVAFYDKRFGTNRGSLKHIIFSILQFPFTVVERAVRVVF